MYKFWLIFIFVFIPLHYHLPEDGEHSPKYIGEIIYVYINSNFMYTYTVEPLITDTAGEFKFCPL
jgi:hypothetical protein